LNHRQFVSLLHDSQCDDEDLPYYTEISWLSCHKALRSYFHLRNKIILFLGLKEQDVSDIRSTKWILDLAVMVNITKYLNELNLNLQEENTSKLITFIYDNVKAFQTKLHLWKGQLKNGNVMHFKTCELQLSINDYSQKI
jgi:hypothetical protein